MALHRIPVFYRPEATAVSRFFAPGTFKPQAVVEDWLKAALPIEVLSYEPATRADFCLAHDAAYVDGVLDCKIANGFGGKQADVAASLPYTTGALIAAAEQVAFNGGVACAPMSGFHHARHAQSAGFCTFNGLVVAARWLQQRGYARRIGILDLDQHYGDGTDDIIARLKLQNDIEHYTAGQVEHTRQQAGAFLRKLPSLMQRFQGCTVLLYQAGADPHVADPLGGWMTDEQLAERDRIVFETAREMRLPLAWDLAGGYQRDAHGSIEPVLRIHRNTMAACIKAYIG